MNHPTSGFTLIELVMVLVILAILASVGAPRFFARNTFDERFYSDDLLSALRYAQKLAVGSGCPVQVSLGPASYALTQRTACQSGTFTRNVVHPGTGESSFTRPAPPGIAVASTVDPLVFDPLGRALDAGFSVADASVSVGGRTLLVVGESGFVYDPAL